MKNLVMGMAVGYTLEKVKPFVLSLRKFYNDRIIFLVDKLDDESNEFYKSNNVEIFHGAVLDRAYLLRYKYYLEILKNTSSVDKVMLTDTRDVIFQDDPFSKMSGCDYEFCAEPELIKNCEHNRKWYEILYGNEELNKIQNNFVICAGTTLGNLSSIMNYLQEMLNEFDRLFKSGVVVSMDQPVHNHLVYSNKLNNYRINENGKGIVSTMHHSKYLRFDRAGRLLNEDNSVTPVVHQYDRCGALSLALLKNSFCLTGKEGINVSSKYAVDNFYEWDL